MATHAQMGSGPNCPCPSLAWAFGDAFPPACGSSASQFAGTKRWRPCARPELCLFSTVLATFQQPVLATFWRRSNSHWNVARTSPEQVTGTSPEQGVQCAVPHTHTHTHTPHTTHPRPTTEQPQTTNRGPPTADHRPQTTDQPQTTDHRPPTTHHRPHTTDQPQTTNHIPPTKDHQPQTTDQRPQTRD